MRWLQLEKHLIPAILIKYVEDGEEDGVEDGVEVVYPSTLIHFRDGTSLAVEEDFETVCALLNPIPG